MTRSLLKYSLRSGLLAGVLAATLAGCYADGSVGVRATVVAPPPPPPVYVNANVGVAANADVGVDANVEVVDYVEPTSYVYVAPNVQVIEGYPDPVFLSGGFYWRQEGGVWYSSTWCDRGWAVGAAPEYVAHISNPSIYVNYRGNVNARVGEVGYVGVAASVPVHVGPAPRYIERPPAVRGGAVVHVNPSPAQRSWSNAHVPEGHGPVVHPAGYNQPEHVEPRPVEPVHPVEGHGPVERPGNYNQPEHVEPHPVEQPHPVEGHGPVERPNNYTQPQPTHEAPRPAPQPTHAAPPKPAPKAPPTKSYKEEKKN